MTKIDQYLTLLHKWCKLALELKDESKTSDLIERVRKQLRELIIIDKNHPMNDALNQATGEEFMKLMDKIENETADKVIPILTDALTQVEAMRVTSLN